jgi:hypothetical protein
MVAPMGTTSAAPDGWGLTMRSNLMQFTIRMIVALGIAVVGIIAIGDVVAYSSVERPWVIKQATLASPLRSPAPKAEFRLSEYQQLGGHFFRTQRPW